MYLNSLGMRHCHLRTLNPERQCLEESILISYGERQTRRYILLHLRFQLANKNVSSFFLKPSKQLHLTPRCNFSSGYLKGFMLPNVSVNRQQLLDVLMPRYRHGSVGRENLRFLVAVLCQVKRAFLRIWQ